MQAGCLPLINSACGIMLTKTPGILQHTPPSTPEVSNLPQRGYPSYHGKTSTTPGMRPLEYLTRVPCG